MRMFAIFSVSQGKSYFASKIAIRNLIILSESLINDFEIKHAAFEKHVLRKMKWIEKFLEKCSSKDTQCWMKVPENMPREKQNKKLSDMLQMDLHNHSAMHEHDLENIESYVTLNIIWQYYVFTSISIRINSIIHLIFFISTQVTEGKSFVSRSWIF